MTMPTIPVWDANEHTKFLWICNQKCLIWNFLDTGDPWECTYTIPSMEDDHALQRDRAEDFFTDFAATVKVMPSVGDVFLNWGYDSVRVKVTPSQAAIVDAQLVATQPPMVDEPLDLGEPAIHTPQWLAELDAGLLHWNSDPDSPPPLLGEWTATEFPTN